MNQQLIQRFEEVFRSPPELISSAPGRINIIGEHTDYNRGYVLPAAINLRIHFLAARRDDDTVRIRAEDFKEERSFSLRNNLACPEHHWENYVKGIFWALEERGDLPGGINGLIQGDIPLGAGLSSSAALEVSILNGINTLCELGIQPMEMAKLAQRAENEFVGMKCGLMDQFISVFGEKNTAIYLDCLSFHFENIPLRFPNDELIFLVYDSRVQRELSRSEYNKRRSEASGAENFLRSKGFPGLRDTTQDMIQDIRDEMDETLFKRARHVISENERVQKAVRALRKSDFLSLGKLLFESHMSLRDDYEVSCPEIDLLYDFAKSFSGCLGARLTGAGFGGSGIVLVKDAESDLFAREILDFAHEKGYRKPRIFPVQIDEGARAWIF
jgi:galactokinase